MGEYIIYDVIVVGTGAGGATAAKELSQQGMNILILEKGPSYKSGTAVDQLKTTLMNSYSHKADSNTLKQGNGINNLNYPFLDHPPELMYAEGLGGTTTVSLANACYSCSACYQDSTTSQLEKHDLNLFEELIEASGELKVGPLPAEYMGSATIKIAKAAEKLGFMVESMPKFIEFTKCDKCGLCINGCTRNAKWDANHFLKNALMDGSTLTRNFEVQRVLHTDREVYGVEGLTKEGEIKRFDAKKVIISAGSLNTPKILRNSGITDGVAEGLFVDLFITIGGYLKNAGLNTEIPMGIKSEFGAFFLSPHFSNQLVSLIQEKAYTVRPQDVMGIMVKIADDANGRLKDDGTIEKPLTSKDIWLLKEGYDKSVQILMEAGVEESSIVSTPIRGAHPGGTAAVGRVVNKSMETDIKGLYIADGSVIERAPGRPPILTIIAIAKCVAKNVIQELETEN